MSKQRFLTLTLITAYLVVGTLYAIYTPVWQVPDEPAHYNYIRALAEGEGFPVMEPGDYDQAYVSRLTEEHFPPELSVAPLEYEDHQPPLYYLLATPVFWLFDGAILPLRIFSVLLGAIAVVFVVASAREVFPEQSGYAWIAGGLVAFLPQYVAMMAGINNDALIMALVGLWLFLALRYLRTGTVRRDKAAPLALGMVLGAMLLTKTTGYGVLLLALLVIVLRWRRDGGGQGDGERGREGGKGRGRRALIMWFMQQSSLIFGPALLLGALWWTRNVLVYGWPDLTGMLRHNAVVVGQPQTAAWVARDGLAPFLVGALRTTFRSFWGQFGWMGVVLDRRIYQGLLIFSLLVLWGAGWHIIPSLRKRALKLQQREAFVLLAALALITLGLYVGYNLTFVQHQGRYLFTALPALALVGAMGLNKLVERRVAVITALGLLATVLFLGLTTLLFGDYKAPMWPMALLGVAALVELAAGLLPEEAHSLFAIGLLVALFALDLWCLFGFIVPMLA